MNMNIYHFSKVIGLASLGSICACNSQVAKRAAVDSHPNVIFIAVDDLNDWLGCMKGHPNTKTPYIDRLASQGVLLNNAHCQAPLSGPSRASVMTGLRPSTTGNYGMIEDNEIRSGNPVTHEVVFLPEFFRNQGYHTMGIGKLFHTHAPDGVFDESGGRVPGFGPLPSTRFVWDGIGTADLKRYGKTATDWGAFPQVDSLMPDHQSADWAIERLGRHYDKPFFLAVGFLRPHAPFYVPQKWFDLHPVEGIALPPYKADDLDDLPEVALQINDLPMMPSTQWAMESGEWVNIVRAYLACVSFVDHQVGRVLEALERSEYAKNTVIVLWSDNGYRLGEKGTFAKHALWEEATKVPLIFSGPRLPKGKVVDSPAELLSIYSTLIDLCGLPKNNRLEGESLVQRMLSEDDSKPHFALTTYGMNNHAVRSGRFRFIRYEDGGEELYDHTNDDNEWFNVATFERFGKQKEDLRSLLPRENALWNEKSSYDMQPYFVDQKSRLSGKKVENK